MAQKDRTLQSAIEIGKKNRRLIPNVKAWCQHIQVEQVSAGMAAEIYDLPMGFFRVTCPHGVSVSEAAHVDWVARDFIVHNCIGCRYHKEVNASNFGRLVLREREEAESLASEAELRRRQLTATAYATAEAALATSEVTERSVNTLILALGRSEDANPAVADSLFQAATVASEFFSDDALRVLVDGFSGEQGDICLAIVRAVGHARGNLPAFTLDTAIIALKKRSDVACALLAEFIQQHGTEPILPFLSDILSVPDYRMFRWRTAEGYHQKPEYPGVIELLHALFHQAPKETCTAFEARLRVDDKDTKLNTAVILRELLPASAAQVLMLAPALIRSLELEDNFYEYSADARVCELVSHLYAYRPDIMEAEIEKFWPSASEEVRVLLYRMYAKTVCQTQKSARDSSDDVDLPFPKERYEQLLPRVIDRLYLAMTDLNLDVEDRTKISDYLDDVLKVAPPDNLPALDRLITRLGMTIREAANFEETRPEEASFMTFRDWDGLRIEYSNLVRSVEDIVGRLIKVDLVTSFSTIQKTLSALDSRQDGSFKAALVGKLGMFGKEYELLPQIIPQLYKHLMDFELVAVRGTAVDVLGDLIEQAPDSVPDNMIELLVAYLSDPYVWIHKSALCAIQHYEFCKDERGIKAIEAILDLENIYWDKNNKVFIQEVIKALYWSFRAWPNVRQYLVTQLLPKYARSKESYFAEDMLMDLSRHVDEFPSIAPQFLQIALDFLKNTMGDHLNDDLNSDRMRIIDSLFTLPSGLIASEEARFRDIVRAKAQVDRIEAIRLLEVLSSHGFHAQVAEIAQEALDCLPDVKANSYDRLMYSQVTIAERAEALIAAGKLHEALTALAEVKDSSGETH